MTTELSLHSRFLYAVQNIGIQLVKGERALNERHSPEVKRNNAYHEAGHILAGKYTGRDEEAPIVRASIDHRENIDFSINPLTYFSNIAGALTTRAGVVRDARSLPDISQRTPESLFSEIVELYGGKAAEVLKTSISEEVGQKGWDEDLETARELAQEMALISPQPDNLDNEIEKILNEAEKQAIQIVEDHEEELDIIANSLIAKTSMDGDQIFQSVKWQPC